MPDAEWLAGVEELPTHSEMREKAKQCILKASTLAEDRDAV